MARVGGEGGVVTVPSAEVSDFILRVLATGKYLVTPDGVVWNLSARGSGKICRCTQGLTGDGYPTVSLSDGKTKRAVLVHRVVALRYIPHSRLDDEVNHKDGDKLNCGVWNLEWVTRSHNVLHAWQSGLRSRYVNRTSRKFVSPLTEDDVREIHRHRQQGKSYGQIASQYSITRSAVYNIVNGKTHAAIYREFHP